MDAKGPPHLRKNAANAAVFRRDHASIGPRRLDQFFDEHPRAHE
jgi:hypothetical protein